MTWEIELGRGQKSYFDDAIKQQWRRLKDLYDEGDEYYWLNGAVSNMTFSNCGFQTTVLKCRPIAEDLREREKQGDVNLSGAVKDHLEMLRKCCNWAHHSKNDTRFRHTQVDKGHMEQTVGSLTKVVDEICKAMTSSSSVSTDVSTLTSGFNLISIGSR
eukprot:scaffold190811_cov48-Prasinocladus_malaysianus.AAC.1